MANAWSIVRTSAGTSSSFSSFRGKPTDRKTSVDSARLVLAHNPVPIFSLVSTRLMASLQKFSGQMTASTNLFHSPKTEPFGALGSGWPAQNPAVIGNDSFGYCSSFNSCQLQPGIQMGLISLSPAYEHVADCIFTTFPDHHGGASVRLQTNGSRESHWFRSFHSFHSDSVIDTTY